MLAHGDNLSQKELHKTKYLDEESKRYLTEIRGMYNKWNKDNVELVGPRRTPAIDDEDILRARTKLFSDYKDFIDQQKYAEKFDSRSNLHSTVLEEFIYYLFKDLVADLSENALMGKAHTVKDFFFLPSNFSAMLTTPHLRTEKKDHDFVIGVNIKATFVCEGQKQGDQEIFQVPALAIECKTYLDKTMLEGSSTAAEQLKVRNPNGIYVVVAEWLKLTEAVNLNKFKVDQIYILRKQKNVDREFRFLPSFVKKPLDNEVIIHLFNTVRNHLTRDWEGTIRQRLERGWLK